MVHGVHAAPPAGFSAYLTPQNVVKVAAVTVALYAISCLPGAEANPANRVVVTSLVDRVTKTEGFQKGLCELVASATEPVMEGLAELCEQFYPAV
ncbi:MAG: hypothetical protein SP1CHLAM54_16860 [Chlamydiia bacterium]|nr:hypothetical protein [Chlamydiia bacterium]MCH9616575.1 hypothetical protein [Chlamydiia bacterium]MCH9629305.1 hypothetical protein [Chlamydiia bacterium]